MADDIIDFDEAKQPHAFRRKENKLKAIKKAFAAARGDDKTKPGKKKRRPKKK